MWYDRGENKSQEVRMGEEERTVAAEENFAGMLADDAQGAEEETSAQELAEGLTKAPETKADEAADDGGDEAEEAPEAPKDDGRLEAYKKGIMTLAEDGWTTEEIRAFSQDAAVRENLARGMTLRQAAHAYLVGGREEKREEKRDEKPARRRAVPTTRQTAMGAAESGNMIDEMTDEQFRAFSKRAEAAMMAGKKVRFD